MATIYKASARLKCTGCEATIEVDISEEWTEAKFLDESAIIEAESHGWDQGECPACAKLSAAERAADDEMRAAKAGF